MMWKSLNCRSCSALETINQLLIRHKFTCGRTLIYTFIIKDRKWVGSNAVTQNRLKEKGRTYGTNNSLPGFKECLRFHGGMYMVQMHV